MQNSKYEYSEPSNCDRIAGQLQSSENKIYQELTRCHTNCGSVPKALSSYFKKRALISGMNKLWNQNANWQDLSYQEQVAVLDDCDNALLESLGINPHNKPFPKPRPEFFSLDPEL